MPSKNAALLTNITDDLKRSLEGPLLLEINHSELSEIANDLELKGSSAISNPVLKVTQAIYNSALNENDHTNILYIDTKKHSSDETIIIYDALIQQLEDKIKKELNIDIAKDAIKGALILTFKQFGGDILNAVSFGHASNIVSNTSDYLVDRVSSILESFGQEATDGITEMLSDNVVSGLLTDAVEELTTMSSDEAMNLINEQLSNALYLSPNATENLKALYGSFSEISFAQALQLLLRLIITISMDAPKLIIIKNPHKLDMISLSIISKYFALAKDHRSELPQLSIMYLYEEETVVPGISFSTEQKEHFSKETCEAKLFLDDQRLFLQRYGMLEQPRSDLPVLAIPSSVFVGREKERQKLNDRTTSFKQQCETHQVNKEHGYINMVDVIQAEPGIGKTALYHQHMREFFTPQKLSDKEELLKRTLMLQLYIHNDNGMSGAGSGLTSFVDSIIQEYHRLEAYYIAHHKSKLAEFSVEVTNSFMLNTLAPGLKELKDIALSINKRVYVDQATEGLAERIKDAGSLDKQKNSEEVYFQEIINKLEKLKEVLNLINRDVPNAIMLFIDDIHWIDEQSAKFLITKLLKNNHVRIITTARISDANSRYHLKAEHPQNNGYHLALFEHLNLVTETHYTDKERDNIDAIKEDLTCKDVENYKLDGFDKKLLNELITAAFKKPIVKHADYLSQAIIIFLSNADSESEEAVTLFAIETLNIISDKQFYKNKDETNNENLNAIIKEEAGSFSFTPCTEQEFKGNVQAIFTHIQSTYEASAGFMTRSDEKQDSRVMSVGSFAILEERLRLLAMQFGPERGDAIVQHILFSSILGSPFDSNIVSDSLRVVMQSNDALLKPLQDELKEHSLIDHNEYATLENIYQMINRLVEFEMQYIYSHSLLEIFLEQKLKQFLNSIYDSNNISKAEMKIYEIVYQFIYFDALNILSIPYLDDKGYKKAILSLFTFFRIVKKMYINNSDIKDETKKNIKEFINLVSEHINKFSWKMDSNDVYKIDIELIDIKGIVFGKKTIKIIKENNQALIYRLVALTKEKNEKKKKDTLSLYLKNLKFLQEEYNLESTDDLKFQLDKMIKIGLFYRENHDFCKSILDVFEALYTDNEKSWKDTYDFLKMSKKLK